MGVILVDLANDRHELPINWWNWRPMLIFLRRGDVINDEQLEELGSGCGGRLTAPEALKAATFLREGIIPMMRVGERMHMNGRVSAVTQEEKYISSMSDDELYAAARSCIEEFVSFCETCAGFKVL